MTKHTILRHGEYVKPHYQTAPEKEESKIGESNDAQGESRHISGVLERYTRQKRINTTPVAMGWVKVIFEHAMEYTGSPRQLRGMLLLWGSLGGALGLGLGSFFSQTAYQSQDWFVLVLFGVMVIPGAFVFGIWMLLWTIRLELFRPVDEPVLFDRRHRKVYRIFRQTERGIKGLFKRWPLHVTEYDWNLIDVEHQAKLVTNGSTVTRYHALVFLVKQSREDDKIIDSFTIGNPMMMSEQAVPAVWEHIRRFMEENGPPLPLGESLAPAQPPQTLWQSLGAVGPFGPKYGNWWKEQPALMVLFHLLFPLFVPMFMLWGVFNWLSYKTATPIRWPDEVMAQIGAVQTQS